MIDQFSYPCYLLPAISQLLNVDTKQSWMQFDASIELVGEWSRFQTFIYLGEIVC